MQRISSEHGGCSQRQRQHEAISPPIRFILIIFVTMVTSNSLSAMAFSVRPLSIMKTHRSSFPRLMRTEHPLYDRKQIATAQRTISTDEELQSPITDPLISILPLKNMTVNKLEMTSMSLIGLGITIGVLYSLAMNDPNTLTGASEEEAQTVVSFVQKNIEELGLITENIFDSAVPRTATDFVSVTVGEGIAGVIGASATFVVTELFRSREFSNNFASGLMKDKEKPLDGLFLDSTSTGASRDDGFFTETAAGGDYFLTRAATFQILEGMGIPMALSSAFSVLLATVPYEFIKFNSRRTKQKKMQSKFTLLKELEYEEEFRKPSIETIFNPTKAADIPPPPSAEKVEVKEESSRESFDTVEIFSDITKWLEYEVLIKDFATKTFLPPCLESASFGFVSQLSSQLYTDLIYRYSNYGNEKNREESRSRTFDESISLYVTKCFSSAALFGVYDTLRIPVSRRISEFLSGGVDSCLGSAAYDICVETYVVESVGVIPDLAIVNQNVNSGVAEFDAQIRAFVIAIVGLIDRAGIPVYEVDNMEWLAYGRGLIVSFYSLIGHFFPLLWLGGLV